MSAPLGRAPEGRERLPRPTVLGGGAAGLAACLTLEAAGFSPLLIEAEHQLGGRLRSDVLPDGTLVDRGFQVVQEAYPDLRRWLDPETLDAVAFVPGAKVFRKGRWRTVADPRRAPSMLPATVFSGIGSWSDRLRMWQLIRRLARVAPEALQQGGFPFGSGQGVEEGRGWRHISTRVFLREWGFSEPFVRGFLAPFLAGIFLERKLDTPAAQFLYTFRMLDEGNALWPRGGMSELPRKLAGALRRTEIRCGERVDWDGQGRMVLRGTALNLDDGGVISFPMKTGGGDGIEWNACVNAVFTTDCAPFGKAIIGLIPEADWVVNFHFMEDVLGPVGHGRVNVTALPRRGDDEIDAVLEGIRRDCAAAGLPLRELEWHAAIPRALPRMESVGSEEVKQWRPGVFAAGDSTTAPSLDGALRSGRVAAEAWMQWAEKKGASGWNT